MKTGPSKTQQAVSKAWRRQACRNDNWTLYLKHDPDRKKNSLADDTKFYCLKLYQSSKQ